MLVAYISFEKVKKQSLSDFFDPERLGNGWNDQVRIANGSQGDEADAVGKVIKQVSRYLQTQARFADTTSATSCLRPIRGVSCAGRL